MAADAGDARRGPDKAISELENQIAHLKRSTAELEALLASGVDDDGASLGDEDRAIYAEAVAENARALQAKQAHLDELRRLQQGIAL